MATIIERVKESVTKRHTTALSELAQIARREAQGKTKQSDANRAAELLDALGWKPERFEELVDTAREVIELSKLADDVDGKQQAMRAAQKASKAHQDADERIKKERREHFYLKLQPAQAKAESTYSAACNARARLEQIKQESPEVF